MFSEKRRKKLYTGATILASVAMLSACNTTANTNNMSPLDTVLAQAADDAAMQGKKKESLIILERAYKRNSDDPTAALKYAKALREARHLKTASVVLSSFANDSSIENAAIKTEYAAIQAAMGHYNLAAQYSKQALNMQDNYPEALHILGIALDAQNKHIVAEEAFRRALNHWEGDPTSVMNNLGLNLAAQGKLDEAVSILQQAQALSPQKKEIERNLRIVMALQGPNSYMPDAPIPLQKPDEHNE